MIEESQRFAVQLPLERRAKLYRGLAEICADTHQRAEFLALAKECEALRMHERKVQFELSLEGEGE